MVAKGGKHRHENSTPSGVAQVEIRDCDFDKIDHPMYIYSISCPRDYYLFAKLKEYLCGRHLTDDEEVKCAVWAHFEGKWKKYFLRVLNGCQNNVIGALMPKGLWGKIKFNCVSVMFL